MGVSLVSALSGALLLAASLPGATADDVKIGSRDEIIKSSGALAKSLMTLYEGDKPGKVPGMLPGPPTDNDGDYYWIHGASFLGAYLDYQHLTGDDSFEESVIKGMAFQAGPFDDYLNPNHTASMGNDDQCFWASAAMLAAEYGVKSPEGKPSWLDLAKNAWTTIAHPDRQDDTCGGGLRWQIPPTNVGYDWKQTTANGCFLTLGARLARFTGNDTYAKRAEETWDWLARVKFIDNSTWAVYDGAHVENNCTDISKIQWSMNAAVLIEGAAFMYNFTNGSDIWRDRAQKLTTATLKLFFPDGVAFEVACEGKQGRCPSDALFMKSYLHRWLATATQLAPFLAADVLPVLKTSAEAAAKHCKTSDGGAVVEACGMYWGEKAYVEPSVDKTTGVGEGLSVLSAISGLLIADAKAPATGSGSGGSSSGSGSESGSGAATTSGGAAATPTNKPSAAGRFAVDAKMTLVAGVLAALAWAL